MLGWVYCWRCKNSDRRYIGQTVTSVQHRWKWHLKSVGRGSQTHFHNAIRRHGVDAFELEWTRHIEVFDVSADFPNELNIRTSLDLEEVLLIEHWDTFEGDGYNMTQGGRGTSGWLNTQKKRREHARKIAAGRMMSANEHARRSSAWLYDFRREKYERNRKLGEQAYWATTTREQHARKCGRDDAEHARKSVPKSGSHVPQLVFCIELQQLFQSATDAEHILRKQGYKVVAGNISKCADGKRKTCGGFRWIKLS